MLTNDMILSKLRKMLWSLYNRRKGILGIKWFSIWVNGFINKERMKGFELGLCVMHFIIKREVSIGFSR